VGGKLTNVSVKQTPYNLKNTPDNRLRDQKFVVGLFDSEMKVIKEMIV
jgi:hypothetical protein